MLPINDGSRSLVDVVSLPSIWYSRSSGPGCSRVIPRQPGPRTDDNAWTWPSTVTCRIGPCASIVTSTGKAPGAASPSASNASARRPAKTKGRRRSERESLSVGDWDWSFVVFSLGAHLHELDARGPAARTLARQHHVDHFEVTGQTAPRRRRVDIARADRAGLVGHSTTSLHRPSGSTSQMGPL